MASEITSARSIFSISSSSKRYIADRYLSPASLVIFIASFFSTGLVSFEIFNLSVTSWDLAIILMAGNAAILLAVHDRSRMRVPRAVIVLAVAFGIWVLIEAVRSPQEFRGLTMAVLLLRNYVMVFSIMTILTFSITTDILNKTIFVVGIMMALLAIVLYAPNADLVVPRRPFGSIILLIDEGAVPRLTGLANDPNFFAVIAVISMFFIYGLSLSKRNVWAWAGVAILMAAVILTFSRAGYAALGIGLLALVGVSIFQRNPKYRKRTLIASGAFVIVSIITFASLARLEINNRRTIWDLTAQRFESVADSPRFALWRDLLDSSTDAGKDALVGQLEPTLNPTSVVSIPEPSPVNASADSTPAAVVPEPTLAIGQPDSPAESDGSGAVSSERFSRRLIGNGLRSNEVRLGSYSHSSYLDVTQEMGIVGTALWGAIAVYVAFSLLRFAVSNPTGVQWIAGYAALLVMMGSLSMLFMPHFWMFAAVAIHFSRSANSASFGNPANPQERASAR